VLKKTVEQLVQDAKKQIENLSVEQLAAEIEKGEVLLVDIRERDELQRDGLIEGAKSAPRGMLEFWADPDSKYHREYFDPEKRTVLY
jgi:rhodanese-related sulfurtransferase